MIIALLHPLSGQYQMNYVQLLGDNMVCAIPTLQHHSQVPAQ
jgi:hypothetical protein